MGYLMAGKERTKEFACCSTAADMNRKKSRKHSVPNYSMPQNNGHQGTIADKPRARLRTPCRFQLFLPLRFLDVEASLPLAKWIVPQTVQVLSTGFSLVHGSSQVALLQCCAASFAPLKLSAVVYCCTRQPVLRDLSTQDFGWVSVACARPVALKQCLGLPKPLWHEAGKGHVENSEKYLNGYAGMDRNGMKTPFLRFQVMELCGGEHAELSSVELRKRKDCSDSRIRINCEFECSDHVDTCSMQTGKRSRGQK